LIWFILLNRIDVAKWERHLSPSFSTPSLDHLEASPSLSFGTLNAVASHTLRILSKPDQQPNQRNHLTMVLEQSLSLLLSQALLYILDPRLCAQEKQLLKRELGAELGSFVESIRRQAQRGPFLPSPAVASTTPRPVSSTVHQSFLKLVGHIVQRIFK
jgi:nuclear pore complex protein Nup188